MPLLGSLILDLFSGFVVWLAKYFTQKVAVTLAAVSILSVLIAALYLAGRSLISSLVAGASSLHPMFGAGVGMVITPRSASLITSYITFWVLCELYKWKLTVMQLWARII